jgi:hypothetical protein
MAWFGHAAWGADVVETNEGGVIVMRPVDGSFLRETTRKASQAQARTDRLAAESTGADMRRLARALEAAVLVAGAMHGPHSNAWFVASPAFWHVPAPPRFHRPLPPVGALR